MQKLFNNFNFTGDLIIPDSVDKNGKSRFYQQITSRNPNSTWEGAKINFGLKSSSDTVYVELLGGNNNIYYKNEDGEQKIINFEDRNDLELIEDVPDYKYLVANLGEEKKFLSELDFVSYLNEELPKHKDETLYVRGNIKYDVYDGKVIRRYNPTYVSLAKQNSDGEYDKKFRAMVQIFFDKDAIDMDDFKETKKIIIHGYNRQYISKYNGLELKKDFYLPQDYVIDGNKENGEIISKYFLNRFKVKNKKSVYVASFECDIKNGVVLEPITRDDLTKDEILIMDTFGLSLEEIQKGKEDKAGAVIKEIVLSKPNIKYPETEEDDLELEDLGLTTELLTKKEITATKSSEASPAPKEENTSNDDDDLWKMFH